MTSFSDISIQVPGLETERLRFRAPAMSDFNAEAEFYASDRSIGVGGPYPREKAWSKLCEKIGQWVLRGYGVWALEEKATGTYVGRVGIYHPIEWPEAELAWTMMEAGEGKGYAFEAVKTARDYAYNTYGWGALISVIMNDNTRSIALAERLGCKRDGGFEHPAYGFLPIWRHPGPEALA